MILSLFRVLDKPTETDVIITKNFRYIDVEVRMFLKIFMFYIICFENLKLRFDVRT